VGAVTMNSARVASISAERDKWTRQAFDASTAAAKDLVGALGPIRPTTPIGKLTVAEWGWIATSAISAWVATRAEQATTEGWNLEQTIRTLSSGPDINPWDIGSVVAILPKLPEACGDGFNWSKPIGDWSKETIAEFLLNAFRLVQRANIARDFVEAQVASKPVGAETTAREGNAAQLMAREKAAASNPTTVITGCDSDCPF
jgi:hypothetical protein